MSIVYATTADSWVSNTSSSTWGGARGDATTTGAGHNNSNTSYDWAVYNIYSGGRGGNTYSCRRSYFPFDLSGETGGGSAESVELKIYMDNLGDTGDNDDVTIVEATALAGSTDDFGNIFSRALDLGTELVTPISVSTTAGYHTFTLNSDGVTAVRNAITSSGTLTVGLIGDYYDFNGNVPSLNGDETKIQAYYTDHGTSSFRPYLDITYAAAVTDSAIFFGTNF